MEVIVIESKAFENLVNQVIDTVKRSLQQNALPGTRQEEFMTTDQVMKLFGLTSKAHFTQFRSRYQVPFSKVGKTYIYKRVEIEAFIAKKSVNSRNLKISA